VELIVLFLALLLILAGAELFTNGIEWFGRKLELAEGAVGSVLAAVGTALPETMIPLIAILFGSSVDADEIGVGAILGAPFMLATLAMFVTGVAVLVVARRRPAGDTMDVRPAVLARDVRTFGLAYAIAIGAAFLPAGADWARWIVAAALLLIYGRYVKAHFDEDGEAGEELAPLRFHRLDRDGHRATPHEPRLRIVNVQVAAALVFIVVGAFWFVSAVEQIAASAGIDETLLALVIAPIATELPEKFNSVIWIRQGKDTLAMGNITGAMVFQSAIPTVIALLFAPEAWAASGATTAFASAGIAFVAVAAIFIPMTIAGRLRARNLLVGGLLYAAYLGLVIFVIAAGH
jgi:cation:H+ antiporter